MIYRRVFTNKTSLWRNSVLCQWSRSRSHGGKRVCRYIIVQGTRSKTFVTSVSHARVVLGSYFICFTGKTYNSYSSFLRYDKCHSKVYVQKYMFKSVYSSQ